jgi:hypothetical protein
MNLDALKAQHPLLGTLVELLLIGLAIAAVWFAFSILFALLYSALRSPLLNAATYFQSLYSRLLALARACWEHGMSVISNFVQSISMKWIFVENEHAMRAQLIGVRETIEEVGRKAERELSAITISVEHFDKAVQSLVVPGSDAVASFDHSSNEEMREAARTRLTSGVIIVILVPILIALISLNTTMLNKFFESLIDEWLIFQWGIKVSMVLGFFLSILEIALGVIFYNVGRSKERAKNPHSMGPVLMQLLVVVLIGLLALIELYLYYRLSYEMNFEKGQVTIQDNLPAWVHASWLTPFGPIIVVALSMVGHSLISAINDFVDAGLAKSHRKVLDDMQRTWNSLMRSGSDLQKRVGEVKAQCTGLIRGLREADDPAAAVSLVQASLKRLVDAVESARKTRLEPYAAVNEGEGRRIFATLTGMGIALVVVVIVFCWIQLFYTFGGDQSHQPVVTIAGAMVQAVAILIASYKMYPPVVLVIEGNPSEVMQGGKERWTIALGIGCFVAVILYNLALSGAFGKGELQWIPFFLAMVCVGALGLMGRTLPAICAVAKVWAKVVGATVVAAVVYSASLTCWTLHLVFHLIRAVLYVLAYPFLLVFWRSKLRTGEENAVQA